MLLSNDGIMCVVENAYQLGQECIRHVWNRRIL